jgi:ankyrin repeat protein
LQLSQLFELKRESDILWRLGRLPGDLEKAYDELYAMIRAQPGSAPVVAERAIKWVMCSMMPLSPRQLLAAACQDTESDDIRPVDVDIDFVLHVCRNLLVVDMRQSTCGFSHLSVQEYFETRVWTLSQAHAHATKTCLVLLSVEQHQLDIYTPRPPLASDCTTRQPDTDASKPIHFLLLYAIRFWPVHVQKHGEEYIDSRLVALLKAFLGSIDSSSRSYQRWYNMYNAGLPPGVLLSSYRDVRVRLPPSTCATFAICFYGFDKILDDWWDRGLAAPNRRNEDGDTLLHLAVVGGSSRLTRKLLDYGLDVNACGSLRSGSPLTVAAGNGYMHILKLLLDAGADVNQPGGCDGCPLSAAAYGGHIELVMLLLNAGADVNLPGGYAGCALGAAAYRGHIELAVLLLNAGADMNLPGGDHGGPLSTAAFVGHIEIVMLLLSAGADVNLPGGCAGCALGAAAYAGHVELMKLLLNAGAEVNLSSGEYGCPLGAAACGGNSEAVTLLLAHGANVSFRGGSCAQIQLEGALSNRGAVAWLHLAVSFGGGADDYALNAAISSAVMSPYQEKRRVLQQLLHAWASSPEPARDVTLTMRYHDPCRARARQTPCFRKEYTSRRNSM